MNKISETQVAQIWQRQLLNKTMLITEDSHPLEVVYPGRPNDDRGADFRDAVISANRSLLKGDIEVHVRSSDWHSHGHDSDIAYNNVILHVVMWHNCRRATALQDGREVPILALEKYITAGGTTVSTSRGPPCAGCSPEIIEELLDKAGEIRFLAKADRFRDRLGRTGAAQALFEGIMEALGYAKNRQTFLELAERLPLEVLESVIQSHLPDNECLASLQALLLGTAGLRPAWHFPDSMSPQSWNTFKVRPQNSPVHRLIAMSHLLMRYRGRGILEGMTGKLVPGRNEVKREHDILERAFMVGTTGRPGRNVALLGRERAAGIVINVLLPFSYVWGHLTRRTGLKQKAIDLFRHYPGRTVNSIEKHMGRQLGLNHKAFRSVRRQQGLLHIYKSLCTQGKCGECALGQSHAGQHVHV